jgi:hypothetical protein
MADVDEQDDDAVDFRDLTRSALERMLVRAMRRKKSGGRDPEDKDSDQDADKEREDLADLVEEKRGKSGAPEVKEDDLHPADLKGKKKGKTK